MRINSICCGLTARKPRVMLTSVGKKQISAAIATFALHAVAEQQHEDRRIGHHRNGVNHHRDREERLLGGALVDEQRGDQDRRALPMHETGDRFDRGRREIADQQPEFVVERATTAVGAGAMNGRMWKTTTASCQSASSRIAAPTGSSRRRQAAERAAAMNSARAALSVAKVSLSVG